MAEVDENKTAAKQPASEKRRDKPAPSLMRKFCLRGGDVPL